MVFYNLQDSPNKNPWVCFCFRIAKKWENTKQWCSTQKHKKTNQTKNNCNNNSNDVVKTYKSSTGTPLEFEIMGLQLTLVTKGGPFCNTSSPSYPFIFCHYVRLTSQSTGPNQSLTQLFKDRPRLQIQNRHHSGPWYEDPELWALRRNETPCFAVGKV